MAGALGDGGFAVDEGICELPTAFAARAGSGPLTVAICAEYDALPGVGHACGHNVIAAAAVGAALALAPVADEVGLRVVVLGTPAEEGGGGKVLLLERGAFAGVHAAMMVHPWPEDRLTANCLAVSHFDATFTGKGAHASAAPWEGVNALDAMTVAQVAIGLLRQQFRQGDQVHGVILHGGSAANIIPDSVTARYMCRAATLGDLAVLEPRVRACFEAGALATGATLRYESCPRSTRTWRPTGPCSAPTGPTPSPWAAASAPTTGTPPPNLSTDMANVSLAVPTIHPMIGIETGGAVNHQPEFTAAAAGRVGRRRGARRRADHGLDGHRRRHRPRAAPPPAGPHRLSGPHRLAGCSVWGAALPALARRGPEPATTRGPAGTGPLVPSTAVVAMCR